MSSSATALRSAAVLLLALQLAACSKTIQWEEEVPLNTGETIWVKRTDHYVKGGEPGNPLRMTWWLELRAYEFKLHGVMYAYRTSKKQSITGPIGIYVIPTHPRTVSIVDWAGDCTKRGWGEYRPDAGAWKFQQTFDAMLLGQSRNLMGYFSAEEHDIPARVDQRFKLLSRHQRT